MCMYMVVVIPELLRSEELSDEFVPLSRLDIAELDGVPFEEPFSMSNAWFEPIWPCPEPV